jgi:Protein of unknown function (DUF3999)
MKIIHIIVVTLLASAPAMAADFKLEQTKTGEPFYQSLVPMAVYQQTHKSDLSDLTIKNAAGEQVPYALVPYSQLNPNTVNRQETIPLQFSPVKIGALQNPSQLRLELEKTTGSTSVNITSSDVKPIASIAYLIDLGANKLGKKFPPIKVLLVDWQGGENTLNNVKVLSSANLKDWTYAGDATLLSTTSSNAISQHYIKLDNNWNISEDARYLQIRPADDNDTGTITITKVQARYNVLLTLDDEPIWQQPRFLARETIAKTGKINIDYESFGHYPAGRYKIKLPQANTVTDVTVLVRNASNEAWRSVSYGSIRSLADGKAYPNYSYVQNVDARFWRLQFDQASGGIGAENPTLTLGWLPPTVVWNARGQAPFTLSVGDKPSIVNTIAVASMLPNYSAEKLSYLPAANIIGNLAVQAPPSAQNAAAAQPASTWVAAPDYKTWLLWGGLVLGVLLLAGMAYSLIKSERKE